MNYGVYFIKIIRHKRQKGFFFLHWRAGFAVSHGKFANNKMNVVCIGVYRFTINSLKLIINIALDHFVFNKAPTKCVEMPNRKEITPFSAYLGKPTSL